MILETATEEAHINIALVKYWGKRVEADNTPLNDSLSITLPHPHLRTQTTVSKSTKDELILNGHPSPLNSRMLRVLEYVRKYTNDNTPLKIESRNFMPTGCGLASSASGYAALAKALSAYYNISDSEFICNVARLGSGSATRSVYPGLVQWHCEGNQVSHVNLSWPGLVCLVCIVDGTPKSTSSTKGMRRSCDTSLLLRSRILSLRPQESIDKLSLAFAAHNFASFAECVMQESNQLHAICLDTFPPLHYLTDTSFRIMDAIHQLNQFGVTAAYTFDAGPNAFVFCLQPDVEQVRLEIEQFTRGIHVVELFQS